MPKHPIIHVWFIDEKTGEPFAQTQSPIEQLPQSFEASTTLRLGDGSYQVVSATPVTAREFGESGKLRLVLRRQEVTKMDPRKILFSLPTLSEEMPGIAEGTTKLGKQTLELHEDDWRQVELVAVTLQGPVEAELRAIERIYAEHRQGPGQGFNALHIRKEVPRPLEGTWFTRQDLRAALGETTTWLDGIALKGAAGLVQGGFAARLASGLQVYGLEREGRVSVLCLRWEQALGASLAGDARLLAALATREQLCLVDWCGVELLPPSAQRFQAWMAQRN